MLFVAMWVMVGTAELSAAHGMVHIAPQAHCTRQDTLLGFSGNDHALAIEHALICRQIGGNTDYFSLISLVDMASGNVVATFRHGPIERRDRHGAYFFVAPAQLTRANPSYAHATSHKVWHLLQKKMHLNHTAHAFNDDLVRFRLDDDTRAQASVKKTGATLTSTGTSAIGFTIVLRLADGNHVDMGHARFTNHGNTVKAQVQLSYSSKGTAVAATVQCGETTLILVLKTPDEVPVGAVNIGARTMMRSASNGMARAFHAAHPNDEGRWESWVQSLE